VNAGITAAEACGGLTTFDDPTMSASRGGPMIPYGFQHSLRREVKPTGVNSIGPPSF
jgi:hypothetical protein